MRSLHLWQGPGYWCTGHLYGTWQFAPGSMFFCFFFRSLSFLSLSPSSFTSLTMQWSKGGGREEKRGRMEKRGRVEKRGRRAVGEGRGNGEPRV